MNRIQPLVVAFAAFALAFAANAEVKLNPLISDGAVLQQGREVPVWGTANTGEKVTVRFLNQTVSTVAKDGCWMVRLKPLKAGGPFTMTVSGENTVTVEGLLVGEVWLCSGQSNMAFQLSRALNPEEAIAAAADPHLRFFQVPRGAADQPRTSVAGEWKVSSPQTASNFSAVAYFFGRDLRRALKVPIGLIDSSVGGTPAEAWTSRSTLASNPQLKAILDRQAQAQRAFVEEQSSEKMKLAAERHQQAVIEAKAAGKPAPKTPDALADPSQSTRRPSGLYNAMIAPLQPFAIAGVIWYQGENNSGRALEYQTLFPAMIGDWRQAWGQGEFPFLFVQIAPHQHMSPEIREAQLMTLQRAPRTAMAVTSDIGDEKDIHPKAKEPVGARLALAARAIAYGERIPYSGPVCKTLKIKRNKATLVFTHAKGGLVAKGGTLKGFVIAGKDGSFVPAEATIKGNNVIVSAPAVPEPVAVRYGWANTPDINLFNGAGLPASPFRITAK